jgi:hypothetical protein
MKHVIYQIIDDLNLKKKTSVSSQLRKLSAGDITLILDKMDSWYESNRESLLLQTQSDSLFSIWLPRTRAQSLIELSSRCVVSDKIVVDDSFYNYLVMFNRFKEEPDFLSKKYQNFYPSSKVHYDYFTWAEDYFQESICDNLSKLIDFYLRAKPLVDHDQLIPFIDITTTSSGASSLLNSEGVEELWKKLEYADPEVYKISDALEMLSGEIDNADKSLQNTLLLKIKTLKKREFELGLETFNLIGALSYGLLFSRLPAKGMDLLDENTPKLINILLDLFQKAMEKTDEVVPLRSFSNNTLLIPALGQVPFGEVMEVKEKERDSFQRFKAALEGRVAKMSSEPGTDEWEREILAIRSELKKDVADIDGALKSLKQDHFKRLSVEVTSLTFSVALASFGILGQTGNPMSTFEAATGGAGLIASLKSMASNLLAFYREKDSLSKRDTYFLWRLHK